MAKSAKTNNTATIALNKKARYDYHLEQRFEAGLSLEGWEVKSLRAGRGRINEAYVVVRKGEAWLIGAHIEPLPSASTHITPEAARTRKLLLHKRELRQLIGAIDRKGFTLVPCAMYWKAGRAKLEFAMAKGKKSHDKRQDKKQADWQRSKERLLRQ